MMLLRSTKLEQAIAAYDTQETLNTLDTSDTTVSSVNASDTSSVNALEVVETGGCSTSTVTDISIENVENVETPETDACVETLETTPETSLFAEMYRHVVRNETNTNTHTHTQDLYNDTYILCNGASIFYSPVCVLNDVATQRVLPQRLIDWCELLPALACKDVGKPRKFYSDVKKAYTEAVRRYAQNGKGGRSEELRTLYTFSPVFAWHPDFIPSEYNYNVARIWYTLQYAGVNAVQSIGVCTHKNTPILKIVSDSGICYLMPRKTT